LASCLALNEGQVVSHRQLISEVWGGKAVSHDTLHFYVRRLKQKLSDGSIFGLRGVGYYFRAEAPLAAAAQS
jgi:DNA-binding response OmpR family regulator